MDEGLVKKLVEEAEDLELGELLVQMRRCSLPFLLCESEEWDKLEAVLEKALNEEYSGQIAGDSVFPRVKDGYDPRVKVPRHIKEHYVRCYLLCEQGR